MTDETRHHPSGPLAMAISLAAVAGFVDAHLFLHVTSIFVANMSGNMIRVGIEVGDGRWTSAAGSLAALIAFTIGVVAAIAHHDHQLRRGRLVRPDRLLVAEALLTLMLPALVIGLDVDFAERPGPIHVLVVAIGAFAMGIQASALRRVGEIAVATTYGTGTIVRIGEKLALALRRADRVDDRRRSTTVGLLVLVLLSYIAGAAIAAASGSSPELLLIPPTVLAAFAVYVHVDTGLRLQFQQSRDRFRRQSLDA